jgi:TPR repeat protein
MLQGYADAQCSLGCCFKSGEGGLHKSASEAFSWLARAANQGHAVAQYESHLFLDLMTV